MNTEQEAPRPRSALQGRGVRLSVRLHLHAVGLPLLLVPIAMASVFVFPQHLCVECPRAPSHTCAHIHTHTHLDMNWCRMDRGARGTDRQVSRRELVSVYAWNKLSTCFHLCASTNHEVSLSWYTIKYTICRGIFWVRMAFADHIDKIWSRVNGVPSRSVVVTPLGLDVK